MKKLLKIFLIVVILFSFSACSNKKALTEKEIDSILEKRGFDVSDVTNNIEDTNILSVKIARNERMQIEYFVFNNSDNAKLAYKNNVNVFSINKKYKDKEINKEKYNKYIQKTEDNYNVVIRKEKIVFYVSVNIDNKKEVNKILRKLNL